MATGLRQHTKPILGLVYLLVIALLVLLSVQIYRKAMPWQRAVQVSLSTSTPGLELNTQSDVKMQGVRVGEVREITSNGTAATVDIALDPAQTGLIPRNVDAAIIPKTLFGEKYIDLRPPVRPVSARISDGDTIRQSTTSVEIGEVFSNLTPVLRTLKPEQLSLTLNSIGDALSGRGEQLGTTLDRLHTYLTGFTPHVDTLTHDIKRLAQTADIYRANAPNLLRTLANGTRISRELLVPREQSFSTFLDTTIGTAEKANSVLAENAGKLITLTGRARPVAALLEEYSAEFPCLIHAFHVTNLAANQAVGAQGPFVNLSVELITQREPYEYPKDSPRNPASDANNARLPEPIPSWAPHCPVLPERVRNLTDAPPYSAMIRGQNVFPSPAAPPRPSDQQPQAAPASADTARQAMSTAMAARMLRVPSAEVPGTATALLAPLLSDGTVSVP